MIQRFFSRIPPALLALALVAIPHFIFILSQWHAMPLRDGVPIGPTDPDPWMRLTLVREWLTSGDWYNHLVPRSDAPFEATVSPWTRPLDLVIAALTLLQPDHVPLDVRLMHAALLLPWLWMMLLLLGIYRIVRFYSPLPSAYFVATALVAAMPIAWNYFGLGNADHHAPLAVIFIWALGGILDPAPTRRGLIAAGLLLALQLWISFEALILIGIIYAWLGLNWLHSGDRATSKRLAILATSVAFGSLAAIMIEYPVHAWCTPIYDSISIVYVALLTLAALLAWGLYLTTPRSLLMRLAICALGSVVLLLIFRFLYPIALRGPMAEVTPFVLTHFLPRVSEVKPLFQTSVAYLIGASLQPLLVMALCAAAFLSTRFRFYSRRDAAAIGFFTLLLFALYVAQQRWSYYLYPLVPAILAPVLAALFEPDHPAVRGCWPASLVAGRSPNGQMARRLPLIIAIMGLPIALMLLGTHLKNTTKEPAEQARSEARESCYLASRQLIRSGELTRVLGAAPLTILAPSDLGAEILFFTPHRIVASNYHREGAGLEFIWESNRITDSAALRAHLAMRTVGAVLACPTLEQPKDSVIAGIVAGTTPPDWLTPVHYTLPAIPPSKITDDTRITTKPMLLKVNAN